MNISRGSVLSENVAGRLKRKIIDGEWQVNQQIPTEGELEADLMVSRTTIREAIKILVSQNVIRIERGIGTFVAEAPGLTGDPFGFEFVEEDALIRNLCDFRLEVEPVVCELAARNASVEQLGEMKAILDKMKASERLLAHADSRDDAMDDMADLDASFHALLYRMTQNLVFERLIPVIDTVVFENYFTELYRSGRQSLQAAETHKLLYEAIKERDPQRAHNLCRQHMEIMSEECGASLEKKRDSARK